MLVKGGPTNAGCKRPKQEPRPAWTCIHGHENRAYAARCLTAGCNEKRRDA